MTDYAETTLREHRRLAILTHLEGCAEYTGNAAILLDVLRGVGVSTTADQLLTELHWLKEQGLVTGDVAEPFAVVSATVRGVEIARGQATHPAVRRPGPRR